MPLSKLRLLLDAYEQGPDEEDHDCRNCHTTMNPDFWKEFTPFCHSCAWEFLELLVEEYNKMRASAQAGWIAARILAIHHDHTATEDAADKALKAWQDT